VYSRLGLDSYLPYQVKCVEYTEELHQTGVKVCHLHGCIL